MCYFGESLRVRQTLQILPHTFPAGKAFVDAAMVLSHVLPTLAADRRRGEFVGVSEGCQDGVLDLIQPSSNRPTHLPAADTEIRLGFFFSPAPSGMRSTSGPHDRLRRAESLAHDRPPPRHRRGCAKRPTSPDAPKVGINVLRVTHAHFPAERQRGTSLKAISTPIE